MKRLNANPHHNSPRANRKERRDVATSARRKLPILFIFLLFISLITGGRLFLFPTVQSDTTSQTLPFTQNWSNTGLITTNDNWSGVPGIIGYRGDDFGTGSPGGIAVDPQTITDDMSGTPVNVIANQANPDTQATGGVAEFDGIANQVVALQGSGTADGPNLVITINTTGQSNINISYNVRDIDGSTDDAVQPVALQYRVGASGSYTNIPAGFIADATTGPSLATLVTPVSVNLPAAVENQSIVQLRILTTNAVGNDEWVGIDDISITGCGAATVTNTNDSGSGSLRDAIANVCDGGTINFDPMLRGQITLTSGELLIDKSLTIQGPTTAGLTISGNNTSRIFLVNAGVNFTFSNLTISGGQAVSGSGGGIFNQGNLTILNSTLTGNVATSNGGAIYTDGGVVKIINSTISDNTAGAGGGLGPMIRHLGSFA